MRKLFVLSVVIPMLMMVNPVHGYDNGDQVVTADEVIRELQSHVTTLRGNLSRQGKIHKEALRTVERGYTIAMRDQEVAYQASIAFMTESIERIRMEHETVESIHRRTIILAFLSGSLFSALICSICCGKFDGKKILEWTTPFRKRRKKDGWAKEMA